MKISQNGINFIKNHEGCFLNSYDDGTGTQTIGYGHTNGVYQGMTITQEQAEEYLRQDLAEFENRVNTFVNVKLTQNQFDALVSFDFNTGGLGNSTLLALLNAGNYEGASKEFTKWVYINNHEYCQGLMNRRIDEKALFLDCIGQIPQSLNTITSTSDIEQLVQEIQSEINLQFDGNLTVDGKGGNKTISAFKTVRRGAKGNITKWLQKVINKICNWNIGVDGIFGAETETAIINFQRANNLLPDGVVGQATFRKILEKLQGFIY